MEQRKTGLSFGGCLGIALLAVVGGLALLTVIGSRLPEGRKAAGANVEKPLSRADLVEAFQRQLTVNISKLGLKTGLLRVDRSHHWEGPFVINNTLDIPIKDVLITCSFYGQSGTKIEERSVRIYEKFPAGIERMTRRMSIGYVNGQTERFGCRIADISYDLDAVKEKQGMNPSR